jgi:hypothetical protein
MDNDTSFPADIDLKIKKDWKRTQILLTIVLLAAAVSGVFFAANLVRFELLADAQSVISILTPLFLYALFVERAVEVFLTVWRGKESDGLALKVKQEGVKISSQKTPDRAEHGRLELQLAAYKATTRDIAFSASFILGILISLAGVRVLALFVDLASMDELSSFQTAWFTVLDIFVTGALIGGGSDGMHKLVSMILALFDSTKARAIAKT